MDFLTLFVIIPLILGLSGGCIYMKRQEGKVAAKQEKLLETELEDLWTGIEKEINEEV